MFFFSWCFEALCTCEHKIKDTKYLIGATSHCCLQGGEKSNAKTLKLTLCTGKFGDLSLTFPEKYCVELYRVVFTEGLLVSEKNATLWAEI